MKVMTELDRVFTAFKRAEFKYCGTLEHKQLLLTDFGKTEWNWDLKWA